MTVVSLRVVAGSGDLKASNFNKAIKMRTEQAAPQPQPLSWPELWDKLILCNSRVSESVDEPATFVGLQQLLASLMDSQCVNSDDLITLIIYSHAVHTAAEKLRKAARGSEADRMFEFAQSFLAMSLRNIAHISMSDALSVQVTKISREARAIVSESSLNHGKPN
ncbi:hypothetical protein [Neomesorhizobium albiziae]|nr:hypothetical protein [Mesorhizobium albiziae]